MATCFDRIARLFVVRNDGAIGENRTRRAIRTKTARARRTKRRVRTDDVANRLLGVDEAAKRSCVPNSDGWIGKEVTTGLAAANSASSVIRRAKFRRDAPLAENKSSICKRAGFFNL